MLVVLKMLTQWLFMFTLLVVGSYSAPGMSESGTAVKQILDDLFQQYEKGIRPHYGERPTQVGVTAYVLSMESFDESKMEFTLSLYFRQTWNDPRLAYTSQQSSRSRGQAPPQQIVLDESRANKIWRPDTFFVNEKKSYSHGLTKLNEFVKIQSNGSVLLSSRYTMTLQCPMDLSHFPFDKQTCSIELESFATTMADTMYYWAKGEDSLVVSAEVSIPGIRIVRHRIQSIEISLKTGNYSRLEMSFEFERVFGYYILRCYIPMATFVTISLFTLLFANPFLEPLIHVITICSVIWYSESAWIRALPMISYINALHLYLFLCLAHLLLSLFVSLAAAFRYMRQNQHNDSSVCSICKPLTELDNYRGTNSRRVQSKSRSCNPGSVVCYIIKLLVIGLFVASNVLYWLYYRSILMATNQKLQEVVNN